MNVGMTWQQYAEEYEIDFEQLYQRRLEGAGWRELGAIAGINKTTVMRKLEEYCEDKGLDFTELKKVNQNTIIEDSAKVDKGKIKALARAGWTVNAIAIDCHCSEQCVVETLGGLENGSRADKKLQG